MNDEEDQVRAVIEEFTRAIHDRDPAGAVAPLARDAITFDLAPPLLIGPEVGRDPAYYREWFATWKGPIVSRSHGLQIAVGGDLAYAFGLQHMTGTKTDGAVDLWFRVTACFRREDWPLAHPHAQLGAVRDGRQRKGAARPETVRPFGRPAGPRATSRGGQSFGGLMTLYMLAPDDKGACNRSGEVARSRSILQRARRTEASGDRDLLQRGGRRVRNSEILVFRILDSHRSCPRTRQFRSDCRISAPAPEVMTSGSTPRMKASEVIRIARSRVRRLDRRLEARFALLLCLLGELDDQDGILGCEADQHDKPNLDQDVPLRLLPELQRTLDARGRWYAPFGKPRRRRCARPAAQRRTCH